MISRRGPVLFPVSLLKKGTQSHDPFIKYLSSPMYESVPYPLDHHIIPAKFGCYVSIVAACEADVVTVR